MSLGPVQESAGEGMAGAALHATEPPLHTDANSQALNHSRNAEKNRNYQIGEQGQWAREMNGKVNLHARLTLGFGVDVGRKVGGEGCTRKDADGQPHQEEHQEELNQDFCLAVGQCYEEWVIAVGKSIARGWQLTAAPVGGAGGVDVDGDVKHLEVANVLQTEKSAQG